MTSSLGPGGLGPGANLPRRPAHSPGNVEVVREIYRSFRARDYEGGLALLDPGIEVRDRPEVPDPRVYRGHDGVLDSLGATQAAFDELDLVPEAFMPAGDTVVVVLGFRGRGRGSGVPVDEELCHRWTVRDGLATGLAVFSTRDDALRAAER